MKKPRRNIFQDVVNKEDQMTELFCNFLQFKCFRDEFLRLFIDNNDIINNIDDADIKTQENLESGGRPDIYIENDQVTILGEVKVENTGLTVNQPDGYLNHLSHSKCKNKYLIFVIPHNYRYYSDITLQFHKFSKTKKGESINTKIIYWRDIISRIDLKELPDISANIKEYRDFLDVWFEYIIITFSEKELKMMLDKEIPTTIMKLIKIVEYVKSNNKIYKSKIYTDTEEYTVYFQDDNRKDILYFGIWYPFWEAHGAPLSYGIDLENWDKNIVDAFSKIMEGAYIDEHGWRAVGVKRELLRDPDCSVKITKHIGELVKQLLEK